MKPINENEFEVYETAINREPVGASTYMKTGLAVLSRIFRLRYDKGRLPARLIRDARMDALEIERSRLAKATLIR